MIFIDGYVSGVTEMTKKMESRTFEEFPEVYKLAAICVIFKENDTSQLATR